MSQQSLEEESEVFPISLGERPEEALEPGDGVKERENSVTAISMCGDPGAERTGLRALPGRYRSPLKRPFGVGIR